jgi:hypothetical protein
LRTVLLLGAAATLVACSDGLPSPIVEGRSGSELRDQGCDWTLIRSTNTTGVDLQFESVGRSGSRSIWPAGSDDPLWLTATIPCVDARTIVFGGVDARADSVAMIRSDGERFEPELFDVGDRDWQAVLGELPARWLAGDRLEIEIVASADGDELARTTLRGWSG